jgi:hypothetical protein
VHEQDFFQALLLATHTAVVAYGPLPIDGEDEAKFSERWLGLIAKAGAGQFACPTAMPVRNFG